MEREQSFYVLGRGAVYVIDGEGITSSNIAEEQPKKTASIYDVKLHVLSSPRRWLVKGADRFFDEKF